MVAQLSSSSRNINRILKARARHGFAVISDDPDDIDRSFDSDSIVESFRQPHKSLSDNEIRQIIQKYGEGISTYVLANEYGCHRRTICNALKKAGITVSNKSSTRDPLLADKVIRMYDEFIRPVDIGNKLGISESSVRRILHESGVILRHSSEYSTKK